MTQFTIHTPEDAPEGSRTTLAATRDRLGFVPNVVSTMAGSPALVQAYTTMVELLGQTRFTPQEQQVAILSVSLANGCDYCMAAHTLMAEKVGVDGGVIEALRDGKELPDTRLEALRRFTTALVETRGWTGDDEVQAFLDAGFEPAHVLDAIMILGMKTLTNYTNHLANTPLDDAFRAKEWKRTA